MDVEALRKDLLAIAHAITTEDGPDEFTAKTCRMAADALGALVVTSAERPDVEALTKRLRDINNLWSIQAAAALAALSADLTNLTLLEARKNNG